MGDTLRLSSFQTNNVSSSSAVPEENFSPANPSRPSQHGRPVTSLPSSQKPRQGHPSQGAASEAHSQPTASRHEASDSDNTTLLAAMLLSPGQLKRLKNLEPVEFMGMVFTAVQDAQGSFAGATTMLLSTKNAAGDQEVSHMLADTNNDGVASDLIKLPKAPSLESLVFVAERLRRAAHSARARVNLAIQTKLAREAMENGDVTTFMPSRSLMRQTPRVQDQANSQLNTSEAFEQRAALRKDPKLQAILTDWFFTMPRSESGQLSKDDYIRSAVSIMQLLTPSESEESMIEVALEDWDRDCKGRYALTCQMFEDCMFELADLWCEGMTADSYLGFLEGLFNVVMCQETAPGAPKLSSLQRWHTLKHVLDAPSIMSEAVDSAKIDRVIQESASDIKQRATANRVRSGGQGGITVVEIKAHLQGTVYEPFTAWLLRKGLANFNRFATSAKGRMSQPELVAALSCFLKSDGFGRELVRKFDANTQTKVLSKLEGARKTKSKGVGDPRRAPRHVQSVSPGFGAPQHSHPPSANETRSNGKRWWLNLQCVSKMYTLLVSTAHRKESSQNFAKAAILLSPAEIEKACATFCELDQDRKGWMPAKLCVGALCRLQQGKGRSQIMAEVMGLYDECDLELTDDWPVSLQDFLSIHNALSVDQITFKDLF